MKTMLMTSSAIPVTPEERRKLRPVSRNNDKYQEMLKGYEQLAIWADELGFDAFGSTEHHFQYEGGESIPSNLLMYAKIAALTKQMTFVPMSVVIPAHDPLRVAEELAQFTHMFPGRLGVSFARGFQTRWMQILAQQEKIVAHQPGADEANRTKFNEYLSIIEMAWANDSFSHDGPNYKIPFPVEGIPDWPLADWTREYGVPGDVDDKGTIHKIGITPKPLGTPEIFIPNTTSDQTVIDSGRAGRTLYVAAGGRDRILQVAKLYQRSANEAGRDLRLGRHFGVVAKVVLGDTFDEAFDLAVETSGFWYQNIFQPFWFNEGYRREGDPPERPLRFPDARALTRRMYEAGQLLCGTAEQVNEQLSEVANLYGEGDLDWLISESWIQSMPHEEWYGVQRYQLETYATQVMPNFRHQPAM
ncbi:LLM class flavin-dependent oxidoreductase [Mycolicibacterium sp. CBMA 226]|uniref:LLM class flavin-dependent oxidoreductase n=1 Tax=Mycolicibacterium sp. CBMA 226 TaxID=2606611 RepID=UPI0012DF2902|nr:LLM class flavin-dependent oxidoreductase [Mycolicibacterium sp. CBMA 226]MUL77137.1 LLM class flavin-dependent oxidoreductase [Mycolicibacterium sp. CBMA 226]